MRYSTLMAVLCIGSLAFAGVTEFGAHGGVFVPTGDMSDAYNISLLLGVNVLSHFASFALEGSASYIFLSPEVDGVSAHMIPLLAGVRSYSGNLFAGGGLALHVASVEVDLPGGGTASDSDSELGAYGNIGTSVPLSSMELELSAKLHWIDFDEMGITLTGGVYF